MTLANIRTHFRANFGFLSLVDLNTRLWFSTMARELTPMQIIPNTGPRHTGTVFFFHGSGSSAEETRHGVAAAIRRDFSFPHLKVVFPNAPFQPYTPLGGQSSNVWFDRVAISSSVPEHSQSLKVIEKDVKQLLRKENESGIPNDRIIVGGISMGGALALYTGYEWEKSLAGVFAISSFLNNGSEVFEKLKTEKPLWTPRLLQFHGGRDDLVPLKSGQDTFDKLSSLGVHGNFFIDEDAEHSATSFELINVHTWIQNLLPDNK